MLAWRAAGGMQLALRFENPQTGDRCTLTCESDAEEIRAADARSGGRANDFAKA